VMATENKAFTRVASGYVRTLDQFHQFAYNWIYPLSGIVAVLPFYFSAAAGFFPGANIALAAAIATVVALIMTTVYALMSSSMPRSGGDYVWTSRLLHPALGVVLATGYWIYTFGWLAYNGTMLSYIFLGSGFQLAGTLLNNTAMLNFAYWCMGTQGYVVLTILVIVVPFFILMGGMKLFGRFIHLSLAILIVVAVVLVGNALVSSPDAFRQAYSSLAGPEAYQGIITTAKDAGWAGNPAFEGSFSMYDTSVFAMMLVGGALIYSWASVSILGEIKGVQNVKKTLLSMCLPVLFTLIVPLFLILQYRLVGSEFATAVYNLAWMGNEAVYAVPVGWDVMPVWLPLITLGEFAAPIIILLTLLLSVFPFYSNCVNLVIPVRYMFAMSFDGAYPRKMAYMDLKRHIPTVGYVIMMIGGLIWLFASVQWPGLWGYISAVIGASSALFIFACIAAVVFPYRMKDTYKASPAARFEIGGLPVISILGALGAISMIYLTYEFLSVEILGGTVNVPTMIAVWIGALVVYYIMKWYRRSKEGIELELVFKEIPPE